MRALALLTGITNLNLYCCYNNDHCCTTAPLKRRTLKVTMPQTTAHTGAIHYHSHCRILLLAVVHCRICPQALPYIAAYTIAYTDAYTSARNAAHHHYTALPHTAACITTYYLLLHYHTLPHCRTAINCYTTAQCFTLYHTLSHCQTLQNIAKHTVPVINYRDTLLYSYGIANLYSAHMITYDEHVYCDSFKYPSCVTFE